MGYYIRVLGKNPSVVPLATIREAARPGIIEPGDAPNDNWEEIVLTHASGQEIAIIERNPVVEGELGSDELLEFIEEVGHYNPISSARWLKDYLPGVKVIYAFQVLHDGASISDGWTIIRKIHSLIWNLAGGIIQADGEGFTNEDGYTILWQFSDNASGTWRVGVLDGNGKWKHFEMDLGNMQHREAFQSGDVPEGVKLL